MLGTTMDQSGSKYHDVYVYNFAIISFTFMYVYHCLLFEGCSEVRLSQNLLVLLCLLWAQKKVHLSTIRNGRQPGDGGLDTDKDAAWHPMIGPNKPKSVIRVRN